MESYFVEAEYKKPSAKQRVRSFAFMAAIYFICVFLWRHFWPSAYEKNHGLLSQVISAAVISVAWAAIMTFQFKAELPDSTVIVDESTITGIWQYRGWMRWLKTQRTVRRGKIRTVRDVKNAEGEVIGTKISERAGFRAWFMGYVFLSKRLSEYEKIRALALLWRSADV